MVINVEHQFIDIVPDDNECGGAAIAQFSSGCQLAKDAASTASRAGIEEVGQGESVFSKLEKTRTVLETSLGLASLLEAYTLVQVCVTNSQYNFTSHNMDVL